jgi:hypothetical protein
MEQLENPLSQLLYEEWKVMCAWVNMYLNELSDEELLSDIISERNHGVWILGHLVASDDTLSEYLGYGPMLFPETQVFAQGSNLMPAAEYPHPMILRGQWAQVCKKNDSILRQLRDVELDEPHTKINGDYLNDYFKTKRNVIINWTFHQLHHAGQLALLVGKFNRRLI